MKRYKTLIFFVGLLIIIAGACNNSDETSKTNLDEVLYQEQQARIIYKIPSPIEIVNLLQNADLEFHNYVLNPRGNWENYNVLKSQTLNLGIYSADLAYTAAYEQYQESILYFDLIRKLGKKVGISTVFNEKMTNRVQNNMANADSLENISEAFYRTMINYLTKNDKNTELALIYTGGWVETLFILCNTIDTVENRDYLMVELAEQKLVAENLMLLLQMDQEIPEIFATYNEVLPIFEIFENLELESSEAIQVASIGDEIVISGGSVYIFNVEQCAILKERVNSVRQNWIKK